MITIAQLAVAYGINNVYDYGPESPYGFRGDGLLLTSGTGGMLSAMDAIPELRWTWVLEGLQKCTPAQLSFMEAVAYSVPVVVVFAFYGVDRPDIARQLLTRVPGKRIVVYSNENLESGRHVDTFDDMVTAVRDLP